MFPTIRSSYTIIYFGHCTFQGWGQLLFSITNTITALHNFSSTIIITITIIQIFSITNTITLIICWKLITLLITNTITIIFLNYKKQLQLLVCF